MSVERYQHAERKARTYRNALLGLAGLLLLSLSDNLASTDFKESRSADAATGGAILLEGGRTRRREPPYLRQGQSRSCLALSLPGLARCAVAPSGAEACWELAYPAMTAIPDGLPQNVATLLPADRIVPPQWLPVLFAGYQPRGLKVLLVLASTPLCCQTSAPQGSEMRH